MLYQFSQLYEKLTPQEQAEVESFAAFLLARRKYRKEMLQGDDISVHELMTLVFSGGSFDWLNVNEENIYTIRDGDEAKWPNG